MGIQRYPAFGPLMGVPMGSVGILMGVPMGSVIQPKWAPGPSGPRAQVNPGPKDKVSPVPK